MWPREWIFVRAGAWRLADTSVVNIKKPVTVWVDCQSDTHESSGHWRQRGAASFHNVWDVKHWIRYVRLNRDTYCCCICARSCAFPPILYFLQIFFFHRLNPVDLPPAHQLHPHWLAIRQRHWHSRASVCTEADVYSPPTQESGPAHLHPDHCIYCAAPWRRAAEASDGEQNEKGEFSLCHVCARTAHTSVKSSGVCWFI